jgi:hypothetical protein
VLSCLRSRAKKCTIFTANTILRPVALADANGDGFISMDEMVVYLSSVFKVMFATHPETEDSLGVSSADLATITAAQCFKDADVDGDGRYVIRVRRAIPLMFVRTFYIVVHICMRFFVGKLWHYVFLHFVNLWSWSRHCKCCGDSRLCHMRPCGFVWIYSAETAVNTP